MATVLLLGGIGVMLELAPAHTALAANPATISFQGKVVNTTGSTNVTDGTYTIIFRLYQNVVVGTYNPNTITLCSADTNCWWEETDSVVVTSGTFQVPLGVTCAFTSACNSGHSGIDFNSQNSLSLTMKFNGDAAGYMAPLLSMQSVPYSLNSDKLGGLTSSGFIQNNSGAAQSSSSFHIDGTGIADVKLQAPAFDTATSNGALGIGSSNAGVITMGNVTNSTFLFNLKNSSATALQIKNGSGNELFTVDTSNNKVLVGKLGTGGINGTITFNSATAGNFIVSIAASGSTAATYTLTLPTTAGSASDCLKNTGTPGILTFGACGAGGGTLASTYNSAATTGNTIALATAGGGIIVQDASSTVGNLFTLQNNGGTANYFNVTSSAITIEDSGATHRTAVSIDITGHVLKVFSPDGTTNFASINATNTDATFKSNTGSTIIGNGTGAITVNAGSGSAVNITGHANSTWQVDSGGSLTIQGGSTLSLSSASSSTITLDSGTTGNVNIGTGANAKAVAIGNSQSATTVTQTTGGTTNVQSNAGDIIKTTTNSATAFVVQNTSSAAILTADTLNSRVVVGSNGNATSQLFVGGTLPSSALSNTTFSAPPYGMSVNGRYMVIQDTSGTSSHKIYDVTTQPSPLTANLITTSASGPNLGIGASVIQGHYAYFADEGYLEVRDISNPHTFTESTLVRGIVASNYCSLSVQGNYAYEACAGTNESLLVFNITNPMAPTVAYVNSNIGNTTSTFAGPTTYIQDHYLYIANQGNNTLYAYDISNPTSPTLASSVTSVNAMGVQVLGRYAYVARNGGGLSIYDISNPASIPAAVGAYSAGTATGALYIQGRVAYLGDGANIDMVDITNPASPSLIGSFAAAATVKQIIVQGRYLYVQYNNASIYGVQIFDVGGAYIQQIEVGGLEATSITSRQLSVTNDTTIQGSLAVGSKTMLNDDLTVGGQEIIHNTINSYTGWQVQNSANTSIADINTLASGLNLIANPNLEVNINGWSVKAGATPTYTDASSAANFGTGALTQAVTTAGHGVQYNFPFAPSTQYSLSFYAKSTATQNFTIGRQDIFNTDVTTGCTNGTNAISITTSYTQFTCTFTTGATITPQSSFFIMEAATAASVTLNIDGITLVAGSTALAFVPPATSIQVDANYNNIIINSLNNAALQPWQEASSYINIPGTVTPLPLEDASTVNANGYIYVIGGFDGSVAHNSVFYAKMNADGSVGTWKCQGTAIASSCGATATGANVTNTNNLPATLRYTSATVANGYVYVIGGTTGTVAQTAIYYAKLNQDGQTGIWQTNTGAALPQVRYGASVVNANGILYVLGGCNDAVTTCTGPQSTIYFGKLTADGSIIAGSALPGSVNAGGLNTNTIALNTARGLGSGFSANGFVYYVGGHNSTGNTNVYYAQIQSDYSLGTSTSSAVTLPANRQETTETVANGYVYILGGSDGAASPVRQNTIYYSALQPDGTIGSWGTISNTLPAIRAAATTTLANGYIYVIGGCGKTTAGVCSAAADENSTIFYSSLPRTQIGGVLDLVGLSSQSLGDAGGAGSLTAGNTRVVGSLTVDGYADFNNGLSVDSALNINAVTAVAGQTVFNINNLNSNSIFSIRHMSTNFGALATTGAFLSKNSYFGEEFNVGALNNCNVNSAVAATTTQVGWARGDAGSHVGACTVATTPGTGELNLSVNTGTLTNANNNCQAASQASAANGVERLIATSSATANSKAMCVEDLGLTATGPNKILLPGNLPVIQMKIDPTTLNASNNNSYFVAGTSDGTGAVAGTPAVGYGMPLNGMFVTNCSTYSTTAPSGCSNTTWYAFVANGGTATPVVAAGCGTLTTTKFAYIRIEVRASNDVHFYFDVDTSNGISETECGTGVTTNIPSAALTPWFQTNFTTTTALSTALDIDYFRAWQDDNLPVDDQVSAPVDSSVPTTSLSSPPISPDSADPAIAGSFFNFNAASAEDTVFNNNVYVHGTLYADKIEANQIEGLSIFTNQISSLQQQLDAIQPPTSNSGKNKEDTSNGTSASSSSNSGSSINFGNVGVSLDLHLLGNLIADGSLTIQGDATFGGHIITVGSAPTIVTETSAGITSSSDQAANLASATVDGNDISGQVSLVLGDTATSGKIFTLIFNKNYSKSPRVIITPSNDQTADLQYYVQSTTSGFKLFITNGQLTPGSTLQFNYLTTQ